MTFKIILLLGLPGSFRIITGDSKEKGRSTEFQLNYSKTEYLSAIREIDNKKT